MQRARGIISRCVDELRRSCDPRTRPMRKRVDEIRAALAVYDLAAPQLKCAIAQHSPDFGELRCVFIHRVQ